MSHYGHLPLRDAYFSPERVSREGGVDPLFRGAARQAAQEIDLQVLLPSRVSLCVEPLANGPRSMYQYSNMAPRFSGQTSLLVTERQKKLKKLTIFTRKPRSHVRILIH